MIPPLFGLRIPHFAFYEFAVFNHIVLLGVLDAQLNSHGYGCRRQNHVAQEFSWFHLLVFLVDDDFALFFSRLKSKIERLTTKSNWTKPYDPFF